MHFTLNRAAILSHGQHVTDDPVVRVTTVCLTLGRHPRTSDALSVLSWSDLHQTPRHAYYPTGEEGRWRGGRGRDGEGGGGREMEGREKEGWG